MRESNTKLSTLQNELGVSGEFKATARNQTKDTETMFVVVKGKINTPPPLDRKALFQLGMLKIRPDGTLKEPNELRIQYNKNIRSVLGQQEKSIIENLLKQHDEVFQGIGKIFDKKKNEELLVKFSLKSDATPVARKPRPVSYYLQEPLRNWLKLGIKEEIFEQEGQEALNRSPEYTGQKSNI